MATVEQLARDARGPARVVTGPREEPLRHRKPLRLHRNESPVGPPWPAIARLAAGAGRLHEYPIGAFDGATRAVSNHLGLSPNQVLLTTGVDEATDLLLLHASGRAHVFSPGFDGYVDRAHALGRDVITHRLAAEFRVSATAIRQVASGDVVFLASPNNPTGHRFGDEEIAALSETGAHVMLDETYSDFAADAPGPRLLEACHRLVVFRSFSKAYGLAGLRIGCLLGNGELISQLAERKPFYSVDSLALEALSAVLSEAPEFPANVAAVTRRHRRRMAQRLADIPLIGAVRETEANFVLAYLADEETALEVARALADRYGILVATTGRMGLPGCLRISVSASSTDMEALVAALTAISTHLQQSPPQGSHHNGHI